MPYCPDCRQEQQEGARCPMCRSFYVERRCAHCHSEVLPKETRCAGCGRHLKEQAPVTVAARLLPAPLARRLGASCVDLVVVLLVADMLRSFLPGGLVGSVAALAVAILAYFGVFQARGRQTLGQYVLGLTVLSEERAPLSPGRSLLRTLLKLLGWVTLLGPLSALLDRERRGWVDRRLGVRTWKT